MRSDKETRRDVYVRIAGRRERRRVSDFVSADVGEVRSEYGEGGV